MVPLYWKRYTLLWGNQKQYRRQLSVLAWANKEGQSVRHLKNCARDATEFVIPSER